METAAGRSEFESLQRALGAFHLHYSLMAHGQRLAAIRAQPVRGSLLAAIETVLNHAGQQDPTAVSGSSIS